MGKRESSTKVLSRQPATSPAARITMPELAFPDSALRGFSPERPITSLDKKMNSANAGPSDFRDAIAHINGK